VIELKLTLEEVERLLELLDNDEPLYEEIHLQTYL